MKNSGMQTLRGLACLLLVTYHVVGSTPAYGLQLEDGWLRWLNDLGAGLRMPLFALLAGAAYGWRPGRGLTLLSGKARRLLLPALTVGTLFAVVQQFTPGVRHQPVDWTLLHLQPVAHFWFLQALFLIFLGVALAELLLPLARPLWGFALLVATGLAYLFVAPWPWFAMAGALYLAPFFVLGMGLTRYPSVVRLQGLALRRPVAALALALAAASMLTWPTAPDADRLTAPLLAAGLASSLGFWLWQPRNRWLAWIGDSSFAIFLFHVFFTAGVRAVLNALGVHALPVHLLAGVLAGVAGPVLLQGWILRSAPVTLAVFGQRQRAAKPQRDDAAASAPGLATQQVGA